MSAGAYRLGISQFTTTPWRLQRDVDRYAAHGVDAVEVCEFKLNRDAVAQQLEAIRTAGMTVDSIQTTVHSLFADSLAPAPSEPRDRLRHMLDGIERIAPHVPRGTPFVAITGAAPQGDCSRVYDWALEALPRLADAAARFGMTIAFEPLNPVLFNTDTALWGLDRALELVSAIDHPALGVCCDTWNVFETPNIAEVIRACGSRIFLVQVSDYCRPRSGADRRCLGDGKIDTAALLAAIRATGYERPYVVEIFSSESLPDSLWKADLDDVIARNLAAFAHLWESAESRV